MEQYRKTVLLVNVNARFAERQARKIIRELDNKADVYKLGRRELIELAMKKLVGKYDLIVVVGGDGTLGRVFDSIIRLGIGSDDVTFAAVGGGSGNDFARALGIRNVNDLLEAIRSGKEVYVDCGYAVFDGRLEKAFSAVLFFGEFALASKLSESRIFGKFVYLYSSLAAVLAYKPSIARVLIDDTIELKLPIFTIHIANAPTTGGGAKLAPGASLMDGYLNVLVVEAMERLEAFIAFPKAVSGKHLTHPRVKLYRRFKKLYLEFDPPIITAPDADCVGDVSSAEVEVVPKIARFIAHPKAL